MKNRPLTEEEKSLIIDMKNKGYQICDITLKAKRSTTTVYQVLRSYGMSGETIAEEKDPLMITPKDIENFKETVHVGDKFRVYREVLDIYGNKSNEYITETITGVYPYIVDCTKGTYSYVELMHCKKVYEEDDGN